MVVEVPCRKGLNMSRKLPHLSARRKVELSGTVKHGISDATYYKWMSKYGGMDASDLKRVRELEAENAKLKRMYADLALENTAMKDLIAKKF